MLFAQIEKPKLLSSLLFAGCLFYSIFASAGGAKINNLSKKDKTYLKNVHFDISSHSVLNEYLKKKHPKEQNEPFMVSMLCQKSKKNKKPDCKPITFEMLSPAKKK